MPLVPRTVPWDSRKCVVEATREPHGGPGGGGYSVADEDRPLEERIEETPPNSNASKPN
jgi:hypothetical protein